MSVVVGNYHTYSEETPRTSSWPRRLPRDHPTRLWVWEPSAVGRRSDIKYTSLLATLRTPARQSLCESHRPRRWLTYWSYTERYSRSMRGNILLVGVRFRALSATMNSPLHGAKNWQLRRCRLPGYGPTPTRPRVGRCVPGRLRRHDTHVASMEQWGVCSR